MTVPHVVPGGEAAACGGNAKVPQISPARLTPAAQGDAIARKHLGLVGTDRLINKNFMRLTCFELEVSLQPVVAASQFSEVTRLGELIGAD